MKYFFGHILLLISLKNCILCNMYDYQETPKTLFIPNKLPFEMLDKRKNVIIYGIPASRQQTQKDTVHAVLEVLSLLQCHINMTDILLVKRLGSTLRKSVAVLVTFATWPIKKMVYYSRYLLKGTPYSMELDFPKVISYRIRLLKPLRDKFIKRGRNASIVWGKLYVDGKQVPDNVCEKYLFPSTSPPVRAVAKVTGDQNPIDVTCSRFTDVTYLVSTFYGNSQRVSLKNSFLSNYRSL